MDLSSCQRGEAIFVKHEVFSPTDVSLRLLRREIFLARLRILCIDNRGIVQSISFACLLIQCMLRYLPSEDVEDSESEDTIPPSSHKACGREGYGS